MAVKKRGLAAFIALAIGLQFTGCNQKDTPGSASVSDSTESLVEESEQIESDITESELEPTESDEDGPFPTAFQVSTTANSDTKAIIDSNGKKIVEAWWFNSSGENYTSLANRLEAENLITSSFADQWREQGNRPVDDLTSSVEVIKMWAVRVASDNATFQIAFHSKPPNIETPNTETSNTETPNTKTSEPENTGPLDTKPFSTEPLDSTPSSVEPLNTETLNSEPSQADEEPVEDLTFLEFVLEDGSWKVAEAS